MVHFEQRAWITNSLSATLPFQLVHDNGRHQAYCGQSRKSGSSKLVRVVADPLVYIFYFYRFVGQYELSNPVILIRDPELVKKILVKDFYHLADHRKYCDDVIEPIFGRNLPQLRGYI